MITPMENWLKFAFKVAQKSGHARFFHAALIIKGGALMSFAANTGYKHAEASALKNMWPSERKGCVLLSVRFTKTGLLANAKPCPACQAWIDKSELAAVWYSTQERNLVKL